MGRGSCAAPGLGVGGHVVEALDGDGNGASKNRRGRLGRVGEGLRTDGKNKIRKLRNDAYPYSCFLRIQYPYASFEKKRNVPWVP